jgi:hypothetical protein
MRSRKESEVEVKQEDQPAVPPSLGFGFVSYTTTEGAAKAKLESKSMTFKGVILYVAQFETREVREAHIAETRDKKQLEKYK